MTLPPDNINDISKAIQLALGPVFLLTGIAGMLNVMSGRLSRIIDRARVLTEGDRIVTSFNPDGVNEELIMLEHRRHVTSNAITMCTIAALMVCLVIVILFIEVMLSIPLNWVIGVLFTLAILALVLGSPTFYGKCIWRVKRSGYPGPKRIENSEHGSGSRSRMVK
jgi:hypothetical protein